MEGMGKIYDALDDRLIRFIEEQRLFFVATAPMSEQGHINLSPKGHDTFAVLDSKTVAYLDLGGSGIETHAHLKENGRITVMFCAFAGKPYILRLYGRGESIPFTDDRFSGLMEKFPGQDRARNVVRIDVHRIQDSCGWGVPQYAFDGDRDQLIKYHAAKSYSEWVYKKNAESLDGLPGLQPPEA